MAALFCEHGGTIHCPSPLEETVYSEKAGAYSSKDNIEGVRGG
jgi:hypothetical protein